MTQVARSSGIYAGRWGVVLILLFLVGLAGCATTSAPVVARQPPEIGPELRCPVCGGYPAAEPRWQSQIIMGDGRQIAFDGCKDMFSYLQLIGEFGYAKKQGLGHDLAEVWVRDYNSGTWLDGRKAWYVIDSDVRGPSGKEIIPFVDQSGAQEFSRAHGGKTLGFTGIDAAVIKMLLQ